MRAPRFRGAVWLDEVHHIRETYGDGAVDAALSALDDADRRALEHVLAVSWVDVEPVMRCKNAIASELRMDHLDFQRAVVRAGVARTVKGFWRLLVRQLSDGALAKRLPILYSRTFDSGELRVETIGDRTAQLRLAGWPGMHNYDAIGLATGLETVCELAGRREPRVRFHRDGGAKEMCFQIQWQA